MQFGNAAGGFDFFFLKENQSDLMGIGNFLVYRYDGDVFFSQKFQRSHAGKEEKFPFSIFRIEIGAQKFSFVQRVIYKAICINFLLGRAIR